ncbi:hypothetical protein ACFFTN_27100 [Aminobacter aganoensis]|uniref:Uncharacterized protein n=1 Tax=Aminobacter aganoensis TaxID=83264 RepID=A0A7X0FD45_9HYPH|nr:hypothetical protein [Aminobacter aganoensis]MBB6357520.1 hypothetical protein [Aminobacter aganoensis]
MSKDRNGDERTHAPGDQAGDDNSNSTLLPMLIAGLVLIVVGAIVVMSFV